MEGTHPRAHVGHLTGHVRPEGGENLYAVGMRLYGRGGLFPSPFDVRLLQTVLARAGGVRDTQILPDCADVDVSFALTGSGVLETYLEISHMLEAGLGQASFLPRATALNLKILEVS